MKNGGIKFFKKLVLVSLPVLFLIILYLVLDPFKVIFKYKSFYKSGVPSYVTLDKNYIGIETFLNNYENYKYEAFILGNSRSLYYEANTWKKYINTDRCIHLDGSGESLYDISRKIKFLDSRNVMISHVLIILDNSTLLQINEQKTHLQLAHPALSGKSWFDFELEFFKTFLSRDFFITFLDFKISNQVKDYMKEDLLLNDVPMEYIPKYNEIRFTYFENLIKTDEKEYYTPKRMEVFTPRDSIQKYSKPVIEEIQNKILSEMAEIFKKQNAEFKIIINPEYDQIKFNTDDLEILNKLFGKQNVFDFSGINSITNDYHNYYENSHYRPHVAEFIMHKIYKK